MNEPSRNPRPATLCVHAGTRLDERPGGVETLICVPNQSSHVKMTAEERQMAGISDGLQRVSMGVEDLEAIREDFARPLARA